MAPTGEVAVSGWLKCDGETEDARLVREALAGSHAAFDTLVERHAPTVSSVLRRFLADPNDLEDAVQETFLRAYQNLRRFRAKATLRTWLIQIGINVCRDRKRAFWQRRVVLTDDSDRTLAGGTDPQSDAALLRQAIDRAVEKLPEKLRIPFTLHAYEELAGWEIAEVLGCSESTIWSRIYAARKQVRLSLGDALED